MILVSFSPGGCLDDVVNNQTNYHVTSVTGSTRVCWIIRGTIFNSYTCLNHS